MKNVREEQLKTCIYLETVEFDSIITEAFGDDVDIEYSKDGICISNDEDCIEFEDIAKAVETYFDIKKVTSIHMDDSDFIGVWVVYKD